MKKRLVELKSELVADSFLGLTLLGRYWDSCSLRVSSHCIRYLSYDDGQRSSSKSWYSGPELPPGITIGLNGSFRSLEPDVSIVMCLLQR
jgi:hypothetical protein